MVHFKTSKQLPKTAVLSVSVTILKLRTSNLPRLETLAVFLRKGGFLSHPVAESLPSTTHNDIYQYLFLTTATV